MGMYLLLGASSDLCCEFIKQHDWHIDDEIIAQYCHSREKLEQLQEKISAKMEMWQADFSDEISTQNFADKLKARKVVPTHILHVPAVPIENMRFTEIDWSATEKQINVQCRSLWMLLQVVIKGMAKAKQGKIILGLSSYSVGVPPKFLAGYVMAKYALMGMGRALASEYAPKGIQINMISPSMMETKFLANIYGGVVEQTAAANPLKRNACPEDVAGLIEYLFSDSNTFVTGLNLPVTGGEIF
ncbi:MAG: SDR family oxidoreductase [Butyrivibrio sp.]|nr:SDR family oxidoreductase [Butyrivibrio sp.]